MTRTRALKLPGVARTFESLARQARDAHWPHEDYLQEVLSAELASRHESVIRQRLREATVQSARSVIGRLPIQNDGNRRGGLFDDRVQQKPRGVLRDDELAHRDVVNPCNAHAKQLRRLTDIERLAYHRTHNRNRDQLAIEREVEQFAAVMTPLWLDTTRGGKTQGEARKTIVASEIIAWTRAALRCVRLRLAIPASHPRTASPADC